MVLKRRATVSLLALPLICLAKPAAAACGITAAGVVACDHNTHTRPTTDTNGARSPSNSRTQRFSNGAPIFAGIAPGVALHGAGLALETTGGPRGAGPSITLTNDGIVAASEKKLGAVALTGTGAVDYRGTGSISNRAGIGLTVDAAGPIAVTIDGAVTGSARGGVATPPGAEFVESGAGTIVIDGSGAVTGPSGRGLIAQQLASGSGGILVTGTGAVAGQGVLCPGGNVSLAHALANGKVGCSGIRAVISGTRNASDVVVNRSGDVTGTSTAINAITHGAGNVTVTTGADAKIFGVNEFGIEATSYGSGRVAVSTGAAGSVVSGGDGIFAVNQAPRVAAASGSSIDVDAAGTITSGTFATAALNDKNPTGALAGISAGYVGGAKMRENAAVNGTVSITNAATIDAKTGEGILGFNFGADPLAITSRAAVDAEAGTGIDARSNTGPTRVDVTGPGAIGTGPGQAALSVTTVRGAVDATVGAGATLRGVAGAVGAQVTGSASPSAAPRTLVNDGTIVGSGAGVVGSGLTIVNDGTIEAGAGMPAISFVGGVDRYGGAGTIPGGIAVTGTAAFTPAPAGSPVGTNATIVGPLSFAATSSYLVRATSTTADALTLAGTATLGGAKVSVDSIGAAAPGTRFTILTATGGLVGQFGHATSNLAFYRPTLGYDADSVTLTARYDFAAPALTRNEAAVGAALNVGTAGTGGRVARALEQVKAGQGGAVLDSLSGEGIAAAETVALRSSQLFTSTIFDQTTFYGTPANSVTLGAAPLHELADLPSRAVAPVPPIVPERTWRAWATGFGGTQDIDGGAGLGTAAQSSTIYGGALGVDYQLTPGNLLGIAVGGSDGSFQVGQRATSGSTTGGHVALYDVATLGPYYAASSVALSVFDNRTTRQAGSALGGLGSTERGTFDATEVRGRFEVGRRITGLGGLVTPFLALEGATLRSQGFAETALTGPGLLGLDVAGRSTQSLPAFVGARAQRAFVLGNGMVFTPTVQAAYVHEFMPDRQLFASIADLPGATFLVDGARPSRDAAQVKAGGALAIGGGVVAFATFDAEVSSVERAYAGKGGLAVTW